MAYTVNRTDGTLLATVADGTVDNKASSSLVIIGKNYAGYGEALNENFVGLLENFANTSSPAAPQVGQLWYNKTGDGSLGVYDGTGFKTLGVARAAAAEPATSNATGDQWFDTVNNQLYVYDGASYILVGPAYASGAGTSGAIVETITDDVAADHFVVGHYVAGERVAIMSKDATFTPSPAITGFAATIQPGLQLADTVNGQNPLFIGDATNALSLGDVLAANYLRSDVDDATSGRLDIVNDAGLRIGLSNDLQITVAVDDVSIVNTAATGDLYIGTNSTAVITIDGATDRARVATPSNGTDITNKDYVDGKTTGAAVKAVYELEANAYTDAKDDLLFGYAAKSLANTVVDFAAEGTQYWTTNANIALTSSNRSAGAKAEAIIEASGADRTITLNASWHNFGEASPIVVPSGKRLVLSFTVTGTAETDVNVAAVLEN
jgi:hypothetical protein